LEGRTVSKIRSCTICNAGAVNRLCKVARWTRQNAALCGGICKHIRKVRTGLNTGIGGIISKKRSVVGAIWHANPAQQICPLPRWTLLDTDVGAIQGKSIDGTGYDTRLRVN